MGGECYDGTSATSGKEVELLWEVNAMMGPVPQVAKEVELVRELVI